MKFLATLRTAPARPLLGVLPLWQSMVSVPKWIGNILNKGYRLQFLSTPPPFRGLLESKMPSQELNNALARVVEEMLAKEAIEMVPHQDMMEGLYSRYFLVPKKPEGLRPILDLRGLNPSITKKEFRMLTNHTLLASITHGDWLTSIDLKDAFFHVGVHPHHRKYLRFFFQGKAYQFRVLPFGYSLAPRTFTLVLQTALEPLLRTGVIVRSFIDDLLIQSRSRAQAMMDTRTVILHLSRLGFSINVEKSAFMPQQTAVYLGIHLDTLVMKARLSDARRDTILSLANQAYSKLSTSAGAARSLLGHMASASVVVPLGLLYARSLQRWFARLPPWLAENPRSMVTIPSHLRPDLYHWTCRSYLEAGVQMGAPSDHLTVFTDASRMGWGGVMDGLHVGGHWHPQEERHINVLELYTVKLVLHHFQSRLQGRHVLIRSDNVATCAYLNKYGGVRSPQLHKVASEILQWTYIHLKSLRASHIQGVLNVGADLMSRGGPIEMEWSLHPAIVAQVWHRFGRASVDLFASRENTKCPLWFGVAVEQAQSLGVDALAHSPWPPGLLYAFPPVPLLLPLLNRVIQERRRIIIVAPEAFRTSWHPLLASLAIQPPWPVPLRQDALSQAGGQIMRPPILRGFRLSVWLTQG